MKDSHMNLIDIDSTGISTSQHQDGLILLNGSTLVPEPIHWLWKGWLAIGKLHLLAGNPGTGKTTIAMKIAATVTQGSDWPDGTNSSAGNVLIWSGEDDYKDTLQPRLMAAGANVERIFFIKGTRSKGVAKPFDPAKNIADIQNAIKTIGNVKLIILDPIVSAIVGDSHKNSETRRDLQPVVDLGLSTGAAVIGITHLSKAGENNDPVARVLGSVAFTAVPRVVMIAAKTIDVDGNECSILVRGKSNIGQDGDGFEYRIDQAEPAPSIHASRIIWGDSVQGSARELIRNDSSQDDTHETSPNQVTKAQEALKTILLHGPVSAKEIEQRTKVLGLKPRTVRRASKEIGIIKRPSTEGPWFWSLPPNLANNDQGQSVDNLDNIDDMAELQTDITV